MNTAIPFSENFLHYIWEYLAFNLKDLKTTQNQKLLIVHPGKHNMHAGADFSAAKIYLDDILWVGDIEIHINANEWLQHHHQEDNAYERVILHVVFNDNASIKYKNGKAIPMLCLKNRIAPELIQAYETLLKNQSWLACQAHLPEIFYKTNMGAWLKTLAKERLQLKSQNLMHLLAEANEDWSTLLYWQLMQALGAEANGAAMLALAKALPLSIIAKHKNNLSSLEALFFGQANLLDEKSDNAYIQTLNKEYSYLKHKYNLQAISATHWKFSKMRPANFPSIRIAQMAQLLHQSQHLFSKILAADSLEDCEELFYVQLHAFWDEHYVLDKKSTSPSQKRLGQSAINLILINTILPLLYTYGQKRAQEYLIIKVELWLSQLPAEKNHIIDIWNQLGAQAQNALESQALLHLYKHYCTPRHCLSCKIGQCLLKEELQNNENPL